MSIPGTYNPMMAGVGGRTLQYVIDAQHTSYGGTITMPTLEVGDVIVIWQAAQASTAPAAAYGTGFTSITTGTVSVDKSTNYRTCWSYRVAVSGDSGKSIGGFLNGNNEWAAVAVWRPSWAGASVSGPNDLSTSNAATGSIGTTKSIGVSASSEFTIAMLGGMQLSFNVPSFTPTAQASENISGGISNSMKMRGVAQNPGGVDVAITLGYNANNPHMYNDFYLEIT